jgi:hypothetical protein
MRFPFAFTATALLISAAVPALSSPYKQANQYFQVRDRAQVSDRFSIDEAQTNPQLYAGKLVEVKGVIKAVAGSEALTTLLIEGGQTTYTVSLPPGKKLASWPFLDVNTTIRALCQVVTVEGSGSGSLELVIPVKEYEASSVDQARAAANEAAAKRVRESQRTAAAPQRRASRGMSGRVFGQSYSDAQLVAIYADAVAHFNRRLAPGTRQRIAWNIIRYSRTYGLDARLMMAVVAVESNFNPNAVSPVGAMGLGQLMPGTAGDLGVGNAFDMDQNLNGSIRLLSNHVRNMGAGGRPSIESVKLALACYNAGAGAVKKYKGIPPYQETQRYVRKIIRLYWQMLEPKDRTWSPE